MICGEGDGDWVFFDGLGVFFGVGVEECGVGFGDFDGRRMLVGVYCLGV